jgi:capping protein alpha
MSADPQTKLKVASYFIKNIPINEVKFALNDVKALLNDNNTFNAAMQAQMLHDYNVNQYVHVDIPGGAKMLLTPFNEVNATSYYDPNTHKAYQVDHIEKKVIAEVGQHTPSSQDKFRTEVQNLLTKYIEQYYKKDKCVGTVFVSGSQLIICISAINSNLSSYWTGNWRATYKLELNATQLQAKTEVNVHYFEDGNVQLNAAFEPKKATQVEKNNAQSIVTAIQTIETEWQNNLDTMYVDMHHKTMKQMRRALPISRTLFDWTTSQSALATELTKK